MPKLRVMTNKIVVRALFTEYRALPITTIYLYLILLWLDIVATSGEDGRKSLMREIELGKLLGENPQTNIVEFIGCVTTQGKKILTTEIKC